jgi:hypothetical protein
MLLSDSDHGPLLALWREMAQLVHDTVAWQLGKEGVNIRTPARAS